MTEFLMNCWYMGGWSGEVSETPMSRRLLGVDVVFYRKANGTIAALRDRCPHRFAPFSKGKVIGDTIQCPYHGLMFDSSGMCVSAPLQEDPPQRIRAQSFPVVEKDHIVWFWPGALEALDPALIPDFSYLSNPAYKHVFGLTHVNAHYELETDNLMDLSHVDMLHPAFAGVLSLQSKYTASRKGNQVQSNWFSVNAPNPTSIEYGPFPTRGGKIDQWLEMRWDPPGAMFLEVAVSRTGETREAGHSMPGAHILTPETETSTLYFWSGSLNADDPAPLDQFRENFVNTFEFEDKPMIERVAVAMEGQTDLLAMKPLLLRSDAGAIMARRVMAELINKEKQSKAVQAAE